MHDVGGVEIRSFRNCFRLERRIHKIDRWRIPIPFGLPLRGLGYAIAIEVAILCLAHLPIGSAALRILPAGARYVVLPIALAYILTRWELDGRPAHAVLRSWLAMQVRPRRVAGWRRAPALGRVEFGAITIAPDDRGSRLRPAVVTGPARVLVRYPFRAHERGHTLRIEPQAGPPWWRGKEIALKPGQRIVIR